MTSSAQPSVPDLQAEPLVSLLRDLEQLVKLESPTSNMLAVCTVQDAVEQWAKDLQAHTHALPGGTRQFLFGTSEDTGAAQQKRVLVLAHADTVWPQGSLSDMPFRVEGVRVYGPGSYDMKGGIVGLFYALRSLEGNYPAGGIEVLLTPDEEIGSHHSRAVIEQAAQRARVVLVIEPPVADSHALKSGRKGVGHFLVELRGVAAHAGNKPREGASAISEAAHQILAVQALADPEKGTTVSVGAVSGGGAVNVIPAQARFEIDLRVSTLEEGERITQAMQALTPRDSRVEIKVSGGLNRPPFERSPATMKLFAQAKQLAAGLGFDLTEEVVGGGSDGNFTAPFVPTLDGLGAPGDGAHAAHEHIRLDRWPDHVRLLTALLREV
ncbi:M20 family metallopeptidase [Deinococcus detaillensis]|uniref:M20 family metallopeptidase n=1 Tax=Deinococcus detaillensis TaxID=2592048 RepID=A0A553V4I4_9DEIO|nr:M20 family metallopeptidase [Deinococcus detaillensis]TSA87352.1 M20 family metallopeptidase [Deinococcus detaillensis]